MTMILVAGCFTYMNHQKQFQCPTRQANCQNICIDQHMPFHHVYFWSIELLWNMMIIFVMRYHLRKNVNPPSLHRMERFRYIEVNNTVPESIRASMRDNNKNKLEKIYLGLINLTLIKEIIFLLLTAGLFKSLHHVHLKWSEVSVLDLYSMPGAYVCVIDQNSRPNSPQGGRELTMSIEGLKRRLSKACSQTDVMCPIYNSAEKTLIIRLMTILNLNAVILLSIECVIKGTRYLRNSCSI